MSVELWFRDSLETEIIKGDLVTLVNDLNVAAANGKQFAILCDSKGEGVMVETRNIIKAREVGDTDAFIGG
jgi:hypothetical protein